MSFRNIVLSNQSYLCLEHNQLNIKTDEHQVLVPIEDIRSVIIENMQTTLSTKLISSLTSQNVTVFLCDSVHMPTGIVLPFQQHSRQRKKIIEQTLWSASFKKKLWKKIVDAKITNQKSVLQINNKDLQTIDQLSYYLNILKSGDTGNSEGSAAHVYFPALFGKKFTRNQENIINYGLNYGYAVVRGLVARAVVGYGFIPALGIMHKNEFNNFNLVDDLIEPFRPLVDQHIYNLFENHTMQDDERLDKNQRQEILKIIDSKVEIEDKKFTSANAIDKYVLSFVQSSKNSNSRLLGLPKFII